MAPTPTNPLAAFLAAHVPAAAPAPTPAPTPAPVANSLVRALADLTDRGVASAKHSSYEDKRIVEMPICSPLDHSEVEAYNRENLLATAYESGFRLWGEQCTAIANYELFGGLFAPIGVGHGKTGISLAIASKAFSTGKGKMLLLVPPQVLYQLVQHDIRWARSKFPINYPIYVLGGRSMAERKAIAKSGQRGLYILTYSLLSTKDTSEVLEAIRPEIIIADEAHNLARFSSARTKRMRDYIEKYKPQFCALSGTITSKSIHDYYHLLKWALRDFNPLPNSTSMAMDWANILDADTEAEVVAHPVTLGKLITWAQKRFPEEKVVFTREGYRKAYRLRLSTAPGVVASNDNELGTSLTFVNLPAADADKSRPGYDRLQQLIKQVEDTWLTPNGDEIEHMIHTFKWLYELSSGFYNELAWPSAEILAKRRVIAVDAAEALLDRAKTHHAAGQEYARRLRRWLQDRAKANLDTPMLVGQSMAQHGSRDVGEELYTAWKAWKDCDFEGRPERDSRAVRVCDYKIVQAVAWAKKMVEAGQGGIIWVHHQEIGKWVLDALRAELDAGRVLYAPAGENAEILDHKNVNKIVVASINAHGTGKNLQHFSQNFFLQWPRPAHTAEQTIGRTHRNGQLADEMEVVTVNRSKFDETVFAACLNDSLYIHQTTGSKQKLIYATYNPLPRIFPPEVLKERGMQPEMLSMEQRKLLEEKFGVR